MKVQNYNAEQLTKILIDRLKEIKQRERIVLKFPFSHAINRIEIYCSETEPKGNGYFGNVFNGIVSLQVFNDYGNKPIEKSSYSYQNEMINFIPKLVQNIYLKLN
jgi:hypothetical protein